MKGFIGDVAIIVILFFVFALVMLFGSYLKTSIDTELNVFDTANVTDDVMTSMTNAFTIADSISLFILVLLFVGLFISVFLIRSHPVLFVFFIIIMAVIVICSAIFANVYTSVGDDPMMQVEANKFPITTHIMDYLPIIVVVLGFAVVVILLSKVGSGGGGL